jgi:hypothetical protein
MGRRGAELAFEGPGGDTLIHLPALTAVGREVGTGFGGAVDPHTPTVSWREDAHPCFWGETTDVPCAYTPLPSCSPCSNVVDLTLASAFGPSDVDPPRRSNPRETSMYVPTMASTCLPWQVRAYYGKCVLSASCDHLACGMGWLIRQVGGAAADVALAQPIDWSNTTCAALPWLTVDYTAAFWSYRAMLFMHRTPYATTIRTGGLATARACPLLRPNR